MRGKISQWKDDKGFGFIQPDDGSENLFFHVSSVKTTARRPQVGDCVFYELTQDSQQRLKANSVVIEGVAKDSRTILKKRPIRTRGPKKGVIDYVSILVFLVSISALGFEFYRSNDIDSSWPYGVPAVISFLILNRQKKPREKSFKCARCGAVAGHDVRSIQAWNNGFTKLYCRICHLQWLKDNPQQVNRPIKTQGGGCLGIMILMAVIPIFSGVALYQLLV